MRKRKNFIEIPIEGGGLMHFWKYCGAGNDFVILENFDGSIAPERYAALAAALCREHFSVGAEDRKSVV